jgi:hypothetical protein
MKIIRTLTLSLGAAMAAVATGFAADHDALPADYRTALVDYVDSRLTDPRGARYQLLSEPYKVFADFKGQGKVPAWAVDVRVRTQLHSGDRGYATYTVIFVDGAPVALEQDIRAVTIDA